MQETFTNIRGLSESLHSWADWWNRPTQLKMVCLAYSGLSTNQGWTRVFEPEDEPDGVARENAKKECERFVRECERFVRANTNTVESFNRIAKMDGTTSPRDALQAAVTMDQRAAFENLMATNGQLPDSKRNCKATRQRKNAAKTKRNVSASYAYVTSEAGPQNQPKVLNFSMNILIVQHIKQVRFLEWTETAGQGDWWRE